MAAVPENIHPIFERTLHRSDKEKFLNQRSKCIWFTGLSGSGKSTIAIALERLLLEKSYLSQILDGDNIRSGINNNLSFSEDDRKENVRRIAEVSKLFIEAGIITINCFVSPTKKMRELAREIIGNEDFIEVFINTPLEVCEKRDVKGLYKKARKGEIRNFTGVDAPFEAPEHPDLEIKTADQSIGESVEEVFKFILPKIKH